MASVPNFDDKGRRLFSSKRPSPGNMPFVTNKFRTQATGGFSQIPRKIDVDKREQKLFDKGLTPINRSNRNADKRAEKILDKGLTQIARDNQPVDKRAEKILDKGL